MIFVKGWKESEGKNKYDGIMVSGNGCVTAECRVDRKHTSYQNSYKLLVMRVNARVFTADMIVPCVVA